MWPGRGNSGGTWPPAFPRSSGSSCSSKEYLYFPPHHAISLASGVPRGGGSSSLALLGVPGGPCLTLNMFKT